MHSELEGARTFTYKVVGDIKIEIDVFEPTSRTTTTFSEGNDACKEQDICVLLFIHGGAWIGGSRHGHSRLLLSEFLQRGYHVASADYRLLPESKFVDEQLEDIRDIEPWLRYTLPGILGSKGEISEISVAGVSAGALLALLTVSSLFNNHVEISYQQLKLINGSPNCGNRIP
jgi:acetyl esterase/lipase